MAAPPLYFKYGNEVERVVSDPGGVYDLTFLGLQPRTIRLDGMASLIDIVTMRTKHNIAWLHESLGQDRGSSEETAIVVTGSPAPAQAQVVPVGNPTASNSGAVTAELVEVMQAGFNSVVATLKAPKASRAALPSGLSSISQSGWKYLQEDFGIDVVAVPTEQMPAVENAAAIPAYDWLPKREDDQKPEYMAHINKIIPLEDRAEWVQGDQYGALLTADQVHTWPEGETEPYHLSGTPDAVVILTAYKDMGLPWEGIRLTVEVKKTVEMKWHIEAGAQLILANIWSSKFKPIALLTDLVNEWHLKYMSGKTLCGGRFPSRAAAVACIKAWLQKEKVTETGAETEDPLAITGPADEERLGPVLKRARYVFSVPGVAPGEACLTDLADCLPRQEAREVFCLAGLHDLMQHYRPLTAAASHSMFS